MLSPSLSSGKWANHELVKKGPAPVELWNILFLTAVGAVVGVTLSTIHHLLHDHSNWTAEKILWDHFVPEMLTAMVGGAILFGGVAALRCWLKQRP
jgi:ABC-type Fe3+-siderophore transport system permease subunit